METSDISIYNSAHIKSGSTSISRFNYVDQESLVEVICEVYSEEMAGSFEDSWHCSRDSYLEVVERWSRKEGCVKLS